MDQALDDEDDEEDSDFIAWLYFTGISKMNLTEEQVGEMTINKFFRIYNQYKRTFDLELRMKIYGKTYSDLEYRPTLDDLIDF